MTYRTDRRHERRGCGCPDFTASRRRLLQGIGVAAGAAALDASVFRLAAFGAETAPSGNVLVVLSLRGGADGLSLVVPHGDSAYATARPSIAVKTEQLLVRDDLFGLHPSLAPLVPMWKAGSMTAVHAVGLPQPNRSHFSAMELVEEADPGSSARVGWLNRLIGLEGLTSEVSAMSVGSAMIPTELMGDAPVLGFSNVSDVRLPGGHDGTSQAAWKRRSLETLYGGDTELDRAGQTALAATVDLAGVGPGGRGGAYPTGPLGAALADSARMIKSQPVRVLTVDYGNWDTHIDLGTPQAGALQGLAGELAHAIAAFFDDLGGDASRVTLVTLSEFGRRVAENGSRGLDHGYGNVMFVFGAGVDGGAYHANWPGLSANKLLDGDLAVTRDYRSVLAEVVASRFDASIPGLFPGFRPESALGFMQPHSS
jgi:uncharacterized protein (DUF1501 family)